MDVRTTRSLQDIIRYRRQLDFVGRTRYLDSFQENLVLPIDDERRRFIYNVFGPGGVGKSWLLKRFNALAQQCGVITAWTDDADGGLVGVMEQILGRFEAQGRPTTFKERVAVVRQSLEAGPASRLGSGPSATVKVPDQGTSTSLGGSGDNVPFAFKSGEALFTNVGFVSPSVVGSRVGEADLDAIRVLTPVFVEALRTVAARGPIGLFFDEYERTSYFLDGWLRAVIEGQYGELPASTIIGIAGQEPLDVNRWGSVETVIARVHLEPFSEEEARDFLARRGIVHDRAVSRFIEVSNRMPVLLATVALGGREQAERVTEVVDDAMGYFLRSIDEPKRTVLLDAALPRRLDADLLAYGIGRADAGSLVGWLRGMPFVEQRGDAWVLRDTVRFSLLQRARIETSRRWSMLHAHLAEYYDRLAVGLNLGDSERWRNSVWQGYALEALYHRLCQSPNESLPLALSGFVSAFGEQSKFARNWARTIRQAGHDVGASELREWGDELLRGLQARSEAHYALTADLFGHLLDAADLDGPARVGALAWRSRLLCAAGRVGSALEVYAELVRAAPEVADYWIEKGTSLARLGYYQKAVEDFDRALALDPRDVWALANRGEACRFLEAYDEALDCFSRALELHPDDARILGSRGQVYVALERFEDALADLNRALELAPHETWVRAERGSALRGLARYEDAMADLNHVLRLEPGNVWALAVRGDIYWQTKRYETARVDFNRALGGQSKTA